MLQLRASRTVYLSSVGAAGVVAAETANSEEKNTSVDLVTDSPAQSAEVEVAPIAVELSTRVLVELPQKVRSIPFSSRQSTSLTISPDSFSIYSKPTQTLVLLDTPSPLELRIGQVRRELCGYYSGARTHVQGVIDRWINVEEMVESSVLVRSRSLPTRFLLPPLSLLGAFAYFLPRTAGRVGDWVEELEGKYAPRAGEVRRTGIAHTNMAWEMFGEKVRAGKEGLGKGARSVVEGIESSTGLKLGDAVGWTKAPANKTSSSDEDKKA
ncbi:hypothetical protein BU15DRAFT_82395 [Melanogaster broomeanus]|nr:hypothetical protein BU15DRAFT_82395 [Melanogaster broomeanus]